MNQQLKHTTADLVAALLIHYSFDLGGYKASELVKHWLNDYPDLWVRCAVIEALYRGRYKAISVKQILAIWQRRGVALYNFNHEFERLVCGNFPQPFAEYSERIDVPVTEVTSAHNINNHSTETTVEAGTGENTPVTVIDPTANNLPQSKHWEQKCDASGGTRLRSMRSAHSDHRALKKSQLQHSSSNSALSGGSHSPIKQFTPSATTTCDLHTKLKAIAQDENNPPQSD